MSNSPYPYKTLASYTMGATIWSDATVLRPDFGTEVSVLPVQEALERTFAVLYYIGSGGVSDVYINGTSPKVAGYTPSVPIKILGVQGLYLESLSGPIASSAVITQTAAIVRSGSLATFPKRRASLPPIAGVISNGADEYIQGGAPGLNIVHRVKNTGPISRDGDHIRIIYNGTAAAGNVTIIRDSDDSEIATLPTGFYSSIDITYDFDDAKWYLSSYTKDVDLSSAVF